MCPEPIAGLGAPALHQEKMILALEILDENYLRDNAPRYSSGIVCPPVHGGQTDVTILAAPAERPHPPISVLRMRDALEERLNPLNMLTTENREAEWKALTPEAKVPISDYVDDFLFHTALYENALTDEAKKRRLLQSLSGRGEVLYHLRRR